MIRKWGVSGGKMTQGAPVCPLLLPFFIKVLYMALLVFFFCAFYHPEAFFYSIMQVCYFGMAIVVHAACLNAYMCSLQVRPIC